MLKSIQIKLCSFAKPMWHSKSTRKVRTSTLAYHVPSPTTHSNATHCTPLRNYILHSWPSLASFRSSAGLFLILYPFSTLQVPEAEADCKNRELGGNFIISSFLRFLGRFFLYSFFLLDVHLTS